MWGGCQTGQGKGVRRWRRMGPPAARACLWRSTRCHCWPSTNRGDRVVEKAQAAPQSPPRAHGAVARRSHHCLRSRSELDRHSREYWSAASAAALRQQRAATTERWSMTHRHSFRSMKALGHCLKHRWSPEGCPSEPARGERGQCQPGYSTHGRLRHRAHRMVRWQRARQARHVRLPESRRQHHRRRRPRTTPRHRVAEYQATPRTPLPARDYSSAMHSLGRQMSVPAVVEAG